MGHTFEGLRAGEGGGVGRQGCSGLLGLLVVCGAHGKNDMRVRNGASRFANNKKWRWCAQIAWQKKNISIW